MDYELTIEQQKLILERWNKAPKNPPSLKELCLLVCGEDADGCDSCGRSIKSFLAQRNLKAIAGGDDSRKTSAIVLTEEQKAYITNNAKTNHALDMARVLFNNPSLTNLNAETRVVNDFIKKLNTKVVYGGQEVVNDIPDTDYAAPKTLDKAIKKINEYVNFVTLVQNLNPQQRKNVERLIEYLHTYRFIRTINTYDSERDRKTCEDAFIRYTYDKPDLTQEEVDQYIELTNHVVQGFKIQRRSEQLQKQLEAVAADNPESQRYSMGLVEAIGKASTEYHQCIDRQKKLLDNLTQKRSQRLELQINEHASILNLVQMWKQEESRKKLLRYGELEQKAIAQEVDRLETISELKARILGINKNTILFG